MDLPPEGMLLGGVALAGDPARGIETTEGLSLLFTTKGITVKGDNPATERHFAWSGLDAASCHGEVQRGGGRTATPLELTSAGQTIQFLLPSETVSPGQAAYLDQALPAWLERYRGSDAPPTTAAAAAAATGSATPTGSPSTPTPPAPPTPTAKAPAPPTPPTPAAPAATPAPSAPASPPLPRSAPSAAAAAVMVPPPTSAEEHIDPETGSLRRGDPLSASGNQGAEGDSRAERKKARASARAAGVPAGDEGAGGKTAATNRRTLMILIVILVIIVIAAVVYEVTKNKNSTSTTTTTVSSASLTVDKALASSVNLQLNDLPSGWTQALGSAPSISATASAGRATQKQPTIAFATCLGTSAATVGQVFGNTPSSDETVASTSPVFQEAADNTIEMQSAVNIVGSSASAKSDAIAFTKSGFISCFTQFQQASASALVPGTTAKVQQVQIAAPKGGVAYGFITTFTVPTQGTRVVGDAYMFGGRIEATLQPSTHGPDVPSDAFNSAYNAMVGRISADASK
jgi:hypothetical protein